MELHTITKQMIGFNKTVFENTYNGVAAVQDYSQRMMDGYMNQFPWISEDCKENYKDARELIKKAQEEYKSVMEQSFAKLEEMSVVTAGK